MTFEPDEPYRTLAGPGESELVVDRSRFLGRARPVESEERAEAFVEELRSEHYDARHVCYGLRVGRGGQRIDRSNDDGEPPRTGGFPIWQVLDGEDVTNSICGVVRYFGGVELGTGGLTRAYRETAREAIDDAGITEHFPETNIELTIPYDRLDAVEHAAESSEMARIVETEYTDDVTMELAVRRRSKETFLDRLGEVLGRELKGQKQDESIDE
ncbi:MAG: YigZ family protein [Bradymonadaceae bacterium]